MKIYRPISSDWKTQEFGANQACIATKPWGGVRYPVHIISKRGNICPAGYTDFYKSIGMLGHNGEDWAAWEREPCYFPVSLPEAGGWWSTDASDSSGGIGVDVISKKPVTLNGRTDHIKFRFWHLAEAIKDTDVELGEIIGYCGNTGASSGTHLHWSVKWCDKDGTAKEKDNGYLGAWDFSAFYKDTFILDYLGKEQKLTQRQQLKQIALKIRKAFYQVSVLLKKVLQLNLNKSVKQEQV